MRYGLILVALLLAARGPARADEAAARPHRERALRLYEEGKLAAALGEFTAAYEADPQPELLLPIGHCHRRLHHTDAALFFYRGLLQYQPDTRDRAEVERLMSELEASRAAAALAPVPGYRRWWVWTLAIGLLAAAGAATGVVIGTWPPPTVQTTDSLGRIDAR